MLSPGSLHGFAASTGTLVGWEIQLGSWMCSLTLFGGASARSLLESEDSDGRFVGMMIADVSSS
jgi:hypothetical protein